MSKVGRFMSAVVAVLALSAGIAAAADTPPAKSPGKVAVRGFNAKGVDQSIAGTLETSFCNALAEQFPDVICPDEMKALAGHEQIQIGVGSCAEDDQGCIAATAKAAEAARVVTGEVSKLGDTYLISVALIDAGTGKVVARGSEKTSKVEDLLDKLPGLAKKLASVK
jgi:hypothetical protein